MQVTALGFRTDIALLKLGGSRVEDRGDHLVVRSLHNPTHWWGNFLLLPRVPAAHMSQSWLECFTQAFPAAAHVALGFDVKEGAIADLECFAAQGFATEAATVMTASRVLEPSSVNRNAECRRLRSDRDWAESIELRIRCEDRPFEPVGFRAYVTARAATYRRIVEAGHGAWFGAFVADRLVAQMGLVVAEPGLARYQAVETDPAHRRRGLAGTLVHHASRYGFAELDVHTLVIVADPDYFAIDLYRSVGFEVTETQLQVELAPPGNTRAATIHQEAAPLRRGWAR